MRRVLLVLALVCSGLVLHAQAAGGDEAAIRAALAAQAVDWNRGDISGFMQVYEDSPETTFIGSTLRKGYAAIFERYKTAYSSPAQMGTLTFSDVEVRLLPSTCGKVEFAVVTGKYHLARKFKGGATRDDGIYSLFWRNGPQGWKIVLDHTS